MTEYKEKYPAVSVIVPMYNCAEFVPDLFDVFSGQSFKDFELIAVIDGATDETEDEVRKLCGRDYRFTCLTRERGGAGAARNTGLDAAAGKYIIFSDADDLYSNDYLLKLYEAAEQLSAEITVCLSRTVDYRTGEIRNIRSFSTSALQEGKLYSSRRAGYPLRLVTKAKSPFHMIDVQVSNKLYLLNFIKDSGLRFSETPASNDVFFSKASLAISNRVAVVHDTLLTIRRYINSESISSNRGEYSQYALSELHKLYSWLDEQNLLKSMHHDYLRFFDGTVNYEIKNGINPSFAENLARMLKYEKPWSDMAPFQITRALSSSMSYEGSEIIDKRKESRACMQSMIKSIAREKYALII